MERKICPYLGLPDDEKTSLAFPSEGNFCHKANPAAPVSREHQSAYCLSGRHSACPVFLARAAAPPPAALASQQTGWERPRKMLRTTILMAVVLIFYLGATWFNGTRLAARIMSLANQIPPSGLDPDANPSPSLPAEPRSTGAPFSSTSPEPEPLAAKECPFPQGWEAYTIQPTDSIFRISILYEVSVEALQKANCLDDQTYLSPGSTLYVPALNPTATSTVLVQPTLAPSSTSTNQPTLAPPNIYVSNPVEESDSGDDDDTPTLIPPTAAPTPEAPVVIPKPDPTQEHKDDDGEGGGDENGDDEDRDDEGGDNEGGEDEGDDDEDRDDEDGDDEGDDGEDGEDEGDEDRDDDDNDEDDDNGDDDDDDDDDDGDD